MKRVSIQRRVDALPGSDSSANDLISTVSSGNSKPLVVLNVTRRSAPCLDGIAMNLSLYAPSDQSSALTEYGSTPSCTAWSRTDLKRPDSLSVRGKVRWAVLAGVG